MHIPVNTYSEAQRHWYSELIARAIRVDGAVDLDEMDFLIRLLHFLNPSERQEVQAMLRSKDPAEQVPKPPEDFSLRELAAIFSELIMLMISDSSLTSKERRFLQIVGERCKLPEHSIKSLLDWGERIYVLERERRQILSRVQ